MWVKVDFLVEFIHAPIPGLADLLEQIDDIVRLMSVAIFIADTAKWGERDGVVRGIDREDLQGRILPGDTPIAF